MLESDHSGIEIQMEIRWKKFVRIALESDHSGIEMIIGT